MTEQAVARTVGFVPPPGVAGARFSPSSMLKVESAATIAERERERERLAKELAQPEAAPPLISKLRTKLDAAIRDRSESGVENMLKEAQLAMNSSYSAEHLKKIQERGYSDIYIQLTETKYNHFLAWLGDFSSNTEGFGFDIAPTPIADLGSKVEGEAKKRAWLDALEDFQDGNPWPDAQSMEAHMKGLVESMSAEAEIQLAEQATKATEAMKKEIDDILAECSFAEIEESFREHIGGFGLGILKGPVIRWRERIDWGENPANPEIRRSAAITVETPSPLDVFPVAGAKSFQDGLFERIWITKETLLGFRDTDGYYSKRGIDGLLEAHPRGYIENHVDTDLVRDKQELATERTANAGERYECWIHWGGMLGSDLADHGLEGVEPLKSYPVEVIFCGTHAIKIMPNPNPLGTVPYFTARLKRRIGSLWGKPMYHLMKDAQGIANGSWRAIITGENVGALPCAVLDIESVVPEDVQVVSGGSVYRYKGSELKNGNNPVSLIHFDTKAHELLALAKEAERMADNATGIPAHTYGGAASGGFDKTASGYMMQLEAASRGLKHTIQDIDRAKRALIENLYNWLMIYSDKPEIKGDAQVVVKGTLKMLFESAQQERVKEFVQYVEQSPMGQELIELDGFNKLLHKYADSINLDSTGILPSEDEIEKRVEQEKQRLMDDLMREYQRQPGAVAMDASGQGVVAGGGMP